MPNFAKYTLLAFPAASAGLGFWQLKRLEWKENLIANLKERLNMDPIDLFMIDSLEDLKGLEYSRVSVKGRYEQDPTKQIFLKPRMLVDNKEASLRGRSEFSRNIGVNVVTPFVLEDSNLRILINRGWLPLTGSEEYLSNAGNGLGDGKKPTEVVGVIRASDNQPKFGISNDLESNEFQFRIVEEMANKLQTAPIYIEATENNPPGQLGTPIGGQTQVKVRNEHLNYAITWFGLSICSLLIWYTTMKKKPAKVPFP